MKNLEMLGVVALGLGTLKDQAVFVGGATIELYLSGEPLLKARPTDDVDCVIELVSAQEYHDMEAKLRARGFGHPLGAPGPICRWQYKGILVDIMPTQGKILGFKNRWYPEGFRRAVTARLPDKQEVRIFDLPYLVASKVEAFKDRGHGDFIGSSDMEDIVTVLDGAEDFKERVLHAPDDVKAFLRASFKDFLRDERFSDALQGNLPPAAGSGRVARARAVLQELAA